MAFLTERLSLLIDAKSGGAVREFQKVSAAAKSLDSQNLRTTKGLDKVGIAGAFSGARMQAGMAAAALGAGVAAQALHKAAEASSALREQQSATNVTFGQSASSVLAFSRTAAEGYGLSSRAALQAANSFGAVFSGLGFTEHASASLSEGLVRLAGDLASFRDIAPEDALQRLQSGIVGETEPLRRLGIVFNESTVKAKAMELGLGEAGRELTEIEKVAARTALIFEKTGKAQGDFARTSGSLANQQRSAAAALENFNSKVGQLAEKVEVAGLQALAEAIEVIQNLTAEDRGGGFLGKIIPTGWLPKLEAGEGLLGKLGQAVGLLDEKQEKASVAGRKHVSTQEALARAERDAGLATGTLSAGLDALRGSQEEATRAAEAQRSKLSALRGALSGGIAATQGLRDAGRGVRDANERVADARQRLNDLLRRGAVDTKAVADAERSLQDATQGVADATERALEARDALNKSLQGPTPQDLEGARIGLEEAQLGVPGALQRLRDATRELNRARSSGNQEEIARAELEVREALLAQRRAALALEDAQSRLTEVENTGAETSDEVRSARERLEDAERDLTRAKDGEAEATRRLNEVQKGDADFAREVADAKRNLRDAEEGLQGAKEGLTGATLALVEAQAKEQELLKTGGGIAGQLREELEKIIALHPALSPLLEELFRAQAGMPAASPNWARYGWGGVGGRGDGAGMVGKGYQSLIDYMGGTGVPFRTTSTLRPGARTKSGNVSLHAVGKAADFAGPNLMGIFNALLPEQARLRELIYSGSPFSIKNGKRVPAYAVEDHWDHVHAATYDQGGILPPGLTLAMNRTGHDEMIVNPRAMGGTTINVGPIHAGMGADGGQIGQEIVEHLAAYVRRNGSYSLSRLVG